MKTIKINKTDDFVFSAVRLTADKQIQEQFSKKAEAIRWIKTRRDKYDLVQHDNGCEVPLDYKD